MKRILSIETSCDETSIALVDTDGHTLTIHGHIVLSQIDVHREYGGVFPSLAKREHAKNLVPILLEILAKVPDDLPKDAPVLPSNLETLLEREPALLESIQEHADKLRDPGIDVIAVTHGPGLEPALWTGINFAKALNVLWGVPVIPTNHMEGHIASVQLDGRENAQSHSSLSPRAHPSESKTEMLNAKRNTKSKTQNTKQDFSSGTFELHNIQFPTVTLLVSGGHTELVLVRGWGDYEILGQTLDDAVGEAFDKAARVLDLSYPGGPEISMLAQTARENGIKPPFSLTRPMLNSGDLNFSFSGIKTSVRTKTTELGELTLEQKQGIAREFEEAVIDVLVAKSNKALEHTSAPVLLVAGGVSANTYLKARLRERESGQILISPPALSTDNALMIALAGYQRSLYAPKRLIYADPSPLEAIGNLSLATPYRVTKQYS